MADAKTPQDLSKKIVSNLIISTIVITLMAAGLFTVGLGYVFLLFVGGMLPGITAYIIDRRPGRFASKTVVAFNLAGLLPQLGGAIASGSPNNTAIAMIGTPGTWLLVYGFAAFGWAVVHLIPQIIYLYLSIKADYTVSRIKLFQDKLVEEWGEGIREAPKKMTKK